MKNSSLICSTIVFSVITTLSGCVVVPAPSHYRAAVVYPDAVPAPVITYEAPPPPRYEVVGLAPVPGYFWISGVWIWKDGHHVWHPGHWSAPRPGYQWAPHVWHQEGRAWHMNGGHWIRSY